MTNKDSAYKKEVFKKLLDEEYRLEVISDKIDSLSNSLLFKLFGIGRKKIIFLSKELATIKKSLFLLGDEIDRLALAELHPSISFKYQKID